MKIVLYLVLLGLIGCSDEAKLDTEKSATEVTAIWETLPKKNLTATDFQNAYLKLDQILIKYPKIDSELLSFLKESREFLKSAQEVIKQNEWSVENAVKNAIYTVNTLTGKGENLLDAKKQSSVQYQQVMEQGNKLEVQSMQLSAKLCKKYGVFCKAGTLFPISDNK